MGVAALLAPIALLLAVSGQAKSGSFRQPIGEVELDWSAGTLTAQAGAAADLRMPNANAARPGAERRARVAAEDKLRTAWRSLGHGVSLDDKALARAVVSRTEYQSNGGVVLWLTLAFGDVIPAKPVTISLRVASMPFALAPVVVASGRTATLGFARYRPAADSPKDAVPARRDSRGRLSLAGAAEAIDSLAGAAVVIYLEKPQP